MKIPEFIRSRIGLIMEFHGIPNRFPNQDAEEVGFEVVYGYLGCVVSVATW
jgi:hypothetical protein